MARPHVFVLYKGCNCKLLWNVVRSSFAKQFGNIIDNGFEYIVSSVQSAKDKQVISFLE
jgi:hypothetical protein